MIFTKLINMTNFSDKKPKLRYKCYNLLWKYWLSSKNFLVTVENGASSRVGARFSKNFRSHCRTTAHASRESSVLFTQMWHKRAQIWFCTFLLKCRHDKKRGIVPKQERNHRYIINRFAMFKDFLFWFINYHLSQTPLTFSWRTTQGTGTYMFKFTTVVFVRMEEKTNNLFIVKFDWRWSFVKAWKRSIILGVPCLWPKFWT